MLCVAFEVDGRTYAIDAVRVVQVAPFVELRPVPQTPEYVRGVAFRHGQVVPVVDLSVLLAGREAPLHLNTRLAFVSLPDGSGSRLLGLLLEGVKGTLRLEEHAPVEGDTYEGRPVQRVVVEEILPVELMVSLCPREEAP